MYDNDKIDASRAAVTTLPDLPEGYRFVNKGLDRVETREVVVHKFMEDPYVSEEVGIRVKLQEVDGKLAVDPNINIEADKFAPGHNLVFDVEKYINDVEKATKQVVEFVGVEGKAPKTNVQDDYKFLGEYNDETKETTWNEKTHAYNSVDIPVVKGYFTDKKQAGGETLTPEKPEVTDTVTYKHLGKILPVDEKGNPIAGSKTPQYLNDLTDPTKALETPVPELEGYVPTVKSVLPKDPGVDTKVIYKKEEKPKSDNPKTNKEEQTVKPAEIQFKFTKACHGGTLKAGQFKFEMRDSSGKVVQTATNDEKGNILFQSIKFKDNEVGTHTYTISEVKGTEENTEYDKMVSTVTVTVTKSDDKLVAKITKIVSANGIDGKLKSTNGQADTEFNNSYIEPITVAPSDHLDD